MTQHPFIPSQVRMARCQPRPFRRMGVLTALAGVLLSAFTVGMPAPAGASPTAPAQAATPTATSAWTAWWLVSGAFAAEPSGGERLGVRTFSYDVTIDGEPVDAVPYRPTPEGLLQLS